MIHDSVLDVVGGTPMVRLQRLTVRNGSEILVKLEGYNPSRSIKDRAALFMIRQAELAGRLHPRGTIIESTSGNFGKSLALIGAVLGYRVILVVDPKTPPSVIDYLTALGAQVVIVDIPDANGGYQAPRIERVRQIVAADSDVVWLDQYNNPDNPRVHAANTAHELLADVGKFDALVASVSTGGHLSGLAATLKKRLPGVVTIGVDAAGSGAFGYPFRRYVMRGIGLGWPPGNLDRSVVDLVQLVADHEGIATSHAMARHEGLLVGESSGAAVFGALHHAHHHPRSRIVVIAADDGANYLGESFNEEWLRQRGIFDRIEAAGLADRESLVAAAERPTFCAEPLEETWLKAS